MSDESKIPAPPAPAPLSPEQQQMNAIADARECCEGTLDILKTSVSLTVANINQVHKYVSWLQSISHNLNKDWTELYGKQALHAAGAVQSTSLKVVPEESNEVVGENPSL